MRLKQKGGKCLICCWGILPYICIFITHCYWISDKTYPSFLLSHIKKKPSYIAPLHIYRTTVRSYGPVLARSRHGVLANKRSPQLASPGEKARNCPLVVCDHAHWPTIKGGIVKLNSHSVRHCQTTWDALFNSGPLFHLRLLVPVMLAARRRLNTWPLRGAALLAKREGRHRGCGIGPARLGPEGGRRDECRTSPFLTLVDYFMLH